MRIWLSLLPCLLVLAGSACAAGSSPPAPPEPSTATPLHADSAVGPGTRLDPGELENVLPDAGVPNARVLNAVVADTVWEAAGPGTLVFQLRRSLRQTPPAELSVSVRLLNRGRDTLEVQHGACPMRLLLYRTPERRDRPVWNSHLQPVWVVDRWLETTCLAIRAHPRIAPGEALTGAEHLWEKRYAVADILGDSLPEGTYYLTTLLALTLSDGPMDSLRIASGELVLKR